MSKKKTMIEVCIWETRGNDPAVFLARTKPALYKAVWEVIKEYWVDVVGQEKIPTDPSVALDVYMEACNTNENGEYLMFSSEVLE